MTKTTIKRVIARQIFDSRGNPTVEVDLTTEGGTFRAAVPSGASTGEREAHELRDGKEHGFHGKGVSKAVENVNITLAPAVIGMDPENQEAVDRKLIEVDGSPNKSSLGANAILAVSLAVCKAGAAASGNPLWKHIASLSGNPTPCIPVPAFNIINGGSHASNSLAIQEFMILPVGASSFKEAMKIGSEIYHTLKKKLAADEDAFGKGATSVGDEGGFAPIIKDHHAALNIIQEAISEAGYTDEVRIGMDVAASEFYMKNDPEVGGPCYNLDFKNTDQGSVAKSDKLTPDDMLNLYAAMADSCAEEGKSSMISIEDPFDQNDWETWTKVTKLFSEERGNKIQIVGDDLTVTNSEIVKRAVEEKACNCLLLKVNQIGTVWESIQAVKIAQEAGWGVMTSHRSGETSDTFIADLAVGLSTGQIKSGAPCRSERLAKYNQLLRIEEEAETIGTPLKYAGGDLRNVGFLRGDLK